MQRFFFKLRLLHQSTDDSHTRNYMKSMKQIHLEIFNNLFTSHFPFFSYVLI